MPTKISDVKLIKLKRFGDHRGSFCEIFQADRARSLGIGNRFVQDNFSHSAEAGTLRGLHFQAPPCSQAKLVTVLQGAVLDVVVDLRRSSPTYGQHITVELSADNGLQIFVPHGFAHGFLTLQADTYVIYKVDAYFAPDQDRGCAWNDPELAISWQIDKKDVILSEKDRCQPLFGELPAYFD